MQPGTSQKAAAIRDRFLRYFGRNGEIRPADRGVVQNVLIIVPCAAISQARTAQSARVPRAWRNRITGLQARANCVSACNQYRSRPRQSPRGADRLVGHGIEFTPSLPEGRRLMGGVQKLQRRRIKSNETTRFVALPVTDRVLLIAMGAAVCVIGAPHARLPASTANSARRAEDNSPRRSDRRSAPGRGRAQGSARIAVAHSERVAVQGGGVREACLSGFGLF